MNTNTTGQINKSCMVSNNLEMSTNKVMSPPFQSLPNCNKFSISSRIIFLSRTQPLGIIFYRMPSIFIQLLKHTTYTNITGITYYPSFQRRIKQSQGRSRTQTLLQSIKCKLLIISPHKGLIFTCKEGQRTSNLRKPKHKFSVVVTEA